MRILLISRTSVGLMLAGLAWSAQAAAQSSPKPSSWTVKISADGRHVHLAYRGQTWVSGLRVEVTKGGKTLRSDATDLSPRPSDAQSGEAVFKVGGESPFELVFRVEGPSVEVSLRGTAAGAEARVLARGVIHGGPEPLQARLDDVEDDVQQMASGRATSQLNDCIYDRFRDQALKVLARQTRFTPSQAGYSVAAGGPLSGAPICRFELVEQVYSKRLPFFRPLDKKKWPRAPVGWCSWYYYFSHVREEDILRNAEAAARDYKPFGLEYCLIDAGWQVAGDGENQTPIGGSWAEPNEKFPHGMKWMADQIRSRGLKPALWLAVFGNADEKFYQGHKDWFLHDENGNAKLGTWFGTYVADFSNPELKKYLYETYRHHTLDWGYDYFKLDGENATRDLWANNRARVYDPTLDADIAFRETLGLIRQAMSSKPNVFFSACGPVYPTESMGVAQSARLGGDVIGDREPPSFRGVRTTLEAMRRGYYTHNIAWYGDPDVLVVRPPLTADEARTWTSILGLSGQLLMLSDDMAALPDDRREMLRKIIPAADVTPMELYPATRDRHIWVLHIERPYGSWAVVGLFNWDAEGRELPGTESSQIFTIMGENDQLLGIQRTWGERLAIATDGEKALAENRRLETLSNKPAGLRLLPVPAYLAPPLPRRVILNFAKAGLEADRDYLLFDFWNQKFLGKMRGEYVVELPAHASQAVSLRPAEDHPQLIGTDRHITTGAVELKEEKWDRAKKQLDLSVSLVENYPTTLTIYAAGRLFKEAKATGASVEARTDGEIVRAKLSSDRSGDARVTLQFE